MVLHDLFRGASVLDEATDPQEVIRLIPKIACEAFGYDRAALCLLDEEKLQVVSVHFTDDPERAREIEKWAPGISFELGEYQPEWSALRHGRALRICSEKATDSQSVVCRTAIGLQDCVLAPMISRGQVIGLLITGCVTEAERPCGRKDLETLWVFSHMAGYVVENLRLRDQAERALERARRRVAELTIHQQVNERFRDAGSVEEILYTLIDQAHTVVDCDYAVAAIRGEHGRSWTVATRGPDDQPLPDLVLRVQNLPTTYPEAADTPLMGEADAMPSSLMLLSQDAALSYLYVPMWIGGETRGFLLLMSKSRSAFLEADLRFTTAITEPAAAYSRAMQSEHRMRTAFSQIGTALSSGLDLQETLQAIVELAASMTEADGASFLVLDEKADTLIVQASYKLEEALQPRAEIPLKQSYACEAISNRRRRMINDTRSADAVVPALSLKGNVRSMMIVPVILRGLPTGVIEVYSHTPSYFRAFDLETLGWFAGHAAIALGNAEAFEREKNIAESFQASMLVEPKLQLEGFSVATRYRAAREEANIGGDFYDFIHMSDGRLCMVVGDVSGKGLHAALYTAMVKYMLRAYAVESGSPAEIVSKLNNALCHYNESGVFVTLFCGIVDPAAHTITHTSAGHEPALVMNEATRTVTQERAPGPALGIMRGFQYPEAEVKLQRGDSLLVYTDGATEARRNNRLLEVEGLSELFRKYGHLNASELVDHLYHSVTEFAGGRLRDDVVLLAIKRIR